MQKESLPFFLQSTSFFGSVFLLPEARKYEPVTKAEHNQIGCHSFISFLHLFVLFGDFAPQQDEETGSDEERPVSNMAVPTQDKPHNLFHYGSDRIS